MVSFQIWSFEEKSQNHKKHHCHYTLTAFHIEGLLAHSCCVLVPCLPHAYKSPASCGLTPGSAFVSRLCCPKAVWVPVRKRRAKATPIQTSFPEPLQQQLHCGAMSNPSAPNQITDAVTSVVHSVSPHVRIQKSLSLSCQVRLTYHQPHDEMHE